jgi:hypothetical protein
MAEWLPRREFKISDPQGRYDGAASKLAKRKIRNSKPPGGGQPDPDLPLDAVPGIIREVRAAISELRLPENRHKPIVADSKGRQWQEAARACRGDLAGYWNDLKLEIGDRVGAPGATGPDDRYLDTVLDLMEVAEREGQLGPWLDLWRDVMDAAWSWEEVRDVVTAVRQAIEFQAALAEHVMEEQAGNLTEVSFRNREDLQLALDSIASEFAAEVDEWLTAFLQPDAPSMLTRLEAIREAIGGPLDAIRSLPSSALAEIDVLLTFSGSNLDVFLPDELAGLARLKQLLGQLGLAARQVDASLDGGSFISPACHRHCEAVKGWLNEIDRLAREIDLLANQIPSQIAPGGWGPYKTPQEMRINLYRTWRLARGRLNALASIAQEVARQVDVLLEGVVRHGLGTELDAVESRLVQQIDRGGGFATLRDDYERGKDHSDRFPELYSLIDNAYSEVRKTLATQGQPDHAPELIDPLEKAQDVELKVALRKWSLQDPEDTYGLAWQLVALLRADKVRAGRLLQGRPALRDRLFSAYDAVADQVARRLAQVRHEGGADIEAIIGGLEKVA